MSQHSATIVWSRSSATFNYDKYNRDHEWHFENGEVVSASAAVDFLGDSGRIDPEEAYVASISSCHMLTFLAICARKKITVDSYRDQAIGFLEHNAHGRLAVTRVELSPEIVFGRPAPDTEMIRKIHHRSHDECFIANSVNTDICVNGLT